VRVLDGIDFLNPAGNFSYKTSHFNEWEVCTLYGIIHPPGSQPIERIGIIDVRRVVYLMTPATRRAGKRNSLQNSLPYE
jgi:hypothetical protein